MGLQENIPAPSHDPEPVRVVVYGPLRHEMVCIMNELVARTNNFVVEKAGWGEEGVGKIRDPRTLMVVIGEDLADPLLLARLRQAIGSRALLIVATPWSPAYGNLKMHSGEKIANTTAVLETAMELRNVILDLFADLLRHNEEAQQFEMRIEWPDKKDRYSNTPN